LEVASPEQTEDRAIRWPAREEVKSCPCFFRFVQVADTVDSEIDIPTAGVARKISMFFNMCDPLLHIVAGYFHRYATVTAGREKDHGHNGLVQGLEVKIFHYTDDFATVPPYENSFQRHLHFATQSFLLPLSFRMKASESSVLIDLEKFLPEAKTI